MNEKLRVALCGIWVNEENNIELAVSNGFKKIYLAKYKDGGRFNSARSEVCIDNAIIAWFPKLNMYIKIKLEVGKNTLVEMNDVRTEISDRYELQRIAYL